MKLILKTLAVLIIIIVFIGTIFFLYNKSRKKPIVFKTTTPFETSIIRKTVATGSVVPRKEIEIKPQVSGVVEKIYLESGDIVEKGTKIAKIKIIPNMVSLNDAEVRVKKADLNLKDTQREWDRRRTLFKKESLRNPNSCNMNLPLIMLKKSWKLPRAI